MKRLLLFALTAAALMPLRALAYDCNAVVTADEAHVFTDSEVVNKAAAALLDSGADVHVISTDYTGPLADVERSVEQACPTWRMNGQRKANLIVFAVSPKGRHKNLFFGGAYAPAFVDVDTVNTIYSHAANPYYKQGDFVAGTAAAMSDFAAKIAAYHDQQQHPVEQQVTNQATDLHGFWIFLYWLLGIGGVCLTIAFLMYLRRKHTEEARQTAEAQQRAIAAQKRVVQGVRQVTLSANVQQQFVDMSNSVSADPTVQGLSAEQYITIGMLWENFYRDNIKPLAFSAVYGGSKGGGKTEQARRMHPYPSKPQTAPAPPASVTAASPTTVVVDHGGSNDLVTGVLLGQEMERSREVDEPVHHHHHESYSSREDDSSSSSSYSSGSDSSWGSSSSDSSSSFGGSDSSWGGGSDSGGGFSSGSDSGF